MLEQMYSYGVEQLHTCCDPATGLRAIIAIHSTRRGPAIGGCRFIHYPQEQAALNDALRLAQGMSYKAALAGLPHGGGKAVIIRPDTAFDRSALMQAFGRMINQLNGDYITAMDSGTQVSDMNQIAQQTHFVTCTSQTGDPSPWTALGVYEGILTSVEQRYGSRDLKGCHINLQGLGHVGMALAQKLYDAGAQLTVCDLSPALTNEAEKRFNACTVNPESIYREKADIFCPCGLGAVINEHTLEQLQVDIVAGSANNQLQTPEQGDRLHQRGILYAPDYLLNAGGLIFVARIHAGHKPEQIRSQVAHIGSTLKQLYQQSEQQGCAPHRIADQQAQAIVAGSAGHSMAMSAGSNRKVDPAA
ncbi:MAG: amino acid dehydrogenase [Marinobacterium sp.]|nr:amino acid dehydrogenase [Marinobacterium sp.]